jgi:hypothetical protein
MKNLSVIILIIFLCLIPKVKAQSDKVVLSGNLQIDSRYLFSQNNIINPVQAFSAAQFQKETSESGQKSPLLAGLFSLVIPGSGEFYSESYLKAGIFLAVEAAVITTAVIYNKKGDNKTNDFQNYADQNWSVVKYAKWMVDNKDQLGLPGDLTYSDIIVNTDPGLPPWKQVDFTELNKYESLASQNSQVGFTHELYPHGEQQYYELIGKYHQYSPGWAQFDPNNNDTHNVPQQMLDYSGMRGKANDYYNIAETFVIGIYVNHFLSALDGAWSAVRFNKNLAINARVEPINLGDRALLVPTLKIAYNF